MAEAQGIVLTLTRTERLPDGTFGRLRCTRCREGDATPQTLDLVTMEDDWLENRSGVSCIPAATYQLHRTIFHRHGYECFEVLDVPGRSRILIHIANTENDVEGCIGVGFRFGSLRVARDEDTGQANVLKRAVVESQAAFRRLMDFCAGADTASLSIRWATGLP